MLSAVRIQNFKCLRDTGKVQLEPVTVLIGKNDTGKTSLLEALSWAPRATRQMDGPRSALHEYARRGGATEPMVWDLTWGKHTRYALAVVPAQAGDQGRLRVRREMVHGEDPDWGFKLEATDAGGAFTPSGQAAQALQPPVDHVHLTSRAQNGDLAAQEIVHRLGRFSSITRLVGRSLEEIATTLDDVVGEDRPTFDALESALRSAFPNIQGIVLRRKTKAEDAEQLKRLHFRITGGEVVDARHASQGVLAFTALLTEVFHAGPTPPELLLLDEPENGIHPRRLRLLAKHLKELSKRCQIILATHSPYFLDLFPPEAVRVFGRKPDGDVVIKNMAELPLVQEWLGAGNSLGEMWFNVGEDRLLGLATDEAAASE